MMCRYFFLVGDYLRFYTYLVLTTFFFLFRLCFRDQVVNLNTKFFDY